LETRVCDVTGFEALNQDVFRVRLRLTAVDPESMHYRAGQYLDILLPEGKRHPFPLRRHRIKGETLNCIYARCRAVSSMP